MTNVIPPFKSLAPEDIPWARAVTERLMGVESTAGQAVQDAAVAQQQSTNVFTAIETQADRINEVNTYVQPSTATAPPTVPILASSMGSITVTWDGALSDVGDTRSVSHVIVEASLLENPDPLADPPYTQVGSIATGSTSFAAADIGAEQGDTVWVRLRSVTYNGLMSEPSVAVSVVVAGVNLEELAPDVYDAILNAQTTADGKNAIFAQETEPVADPEVPFVPGDQWWIVDPANPDGFSGVKIWNGTAWVNYYLVADSIVVPGSVGTIVIADGAITGPKVVANSIETNHLSPSVGSSLDISANGSINFLVGQADANAQAIGDQQGQIEAVAGDLVEVGQIASDASTVATDAADAAATAQATATATAEAFEPLAQTYRFTSSGAFIGAPGSPYEFVIQNTGASIRYNGEDVSTWDADEMWVKQFRGDIVQLGDHQIEKYSGGGTVVRAVN